MMKYSDKVMEHFENPRNVGVIENPSGVGRVGNPQCGDVMEMQIKIENGIVKDVKFKTFGCCAAIATSSILTEMIKGKSIEEALKIKEKNIAEELGGLPTVKMHCSNLASEAFRKAVENWRKKSDTKKSS